jgi:hypothetical protein
VQESSSREKGSLGFAMIRYTDFSIIKSVFIPFVREIRVQKGLITAIPSEPKKE